MPKSVDEKKRAEFERTFLPHLNSAYNLARWLTRNNHDAQDVVQEAYLRAFQAFDGFEAERGGRPWLLQIVRNTCYTWLRQNRPAEISVGLDEIAEPAMEGALDAEALLIEKRDAQTVRAAMERVPVEFREVLILRELEGWSYKEIAKVVGVPLGTVMSRLSRGRRELQRLLTQPKEVRA